MNAVMNAATTEHKIMRTEGNEFCEMEVQLRTNAHGFKVLAITGVYGHIVSRDEAEEMALTFWESFFEDNPEELKALRERVGINFRSPKRAARYVLDVDGEFHGLDVHAEEMRKDHGCRVFLVESCGQIREELARFFPEAEGAFGYHLNDMKSGCLHQEELGWDHNHIGFPCPTCAYKYGSKWLHRELPQSVLDWVAGLPEKVAFET
jgi:hypothetical protein